MCSSQDPRTRLSTRKGALGGSATTAMVSSFLPDRPYTPGVLRRCCSWRFWWAWSQLLPPMLTIPASSFRGAGSGHGVGMGQGGAYGQALADPAKPGEDIAAYYFPGSEPASISDLSLPNDLLHTLDNPLWVNLGSQITLLEFTAVGGPLDLCPRRRR